jgi:hypothetical protein
MFKVRPLAFLQHSAVPCSIFDIPLEPLAKLLPFVVRYLTTNGHSTRYSCKSPFALRYRRVKRTFARGSLIGLTFTEPWKFNSFFLCDLSLMGFAEVGDLDPQKAGKGK